MTILLHKTYFIKVTTRGEEIPKDLTTWFMVDPSIIVSEWMSVALVAASLCIKITNPGKITILCSRKNRIIIVICIRIYGLILFIPTYSGVSFMKTFFEITARVHFKLGTFCLIRNLSILTTKSRSGLTQFKIPWSISD